MNVKLNWSRLANVAVGAVLTPSREGLIEQQFDEQAFILHLHQIQVMRKNELCNRLLQFSVVFGDEFLGQRWDLATEVTGETEKTDAESVHGIQKLCDPHLAPAREENGTSSCQGSQFRGQRADHGRFRRFPEDSGDVFWQTPKFILSRMNNIFGKTQSHRNFFEINASYL